MYRKPFTRNIKVELPIGSEKFESKFKDYVDHAFFPNDLFEVTTQPFRGKVENGKLHLRIHRSKVTRINPSIAVFNGFYYEKIHDKTIIEGNIKVSKKYTIGSLSIVFVFLILSIFKLGFFLFFLLTATIFYSASFYALNKFEKH